MKTKNLSPKVFTPQKPHTKKKNFLLRFEVVLLTIIALGTLITLFVPENFSFEQFIENTKQIFSLKQEKKEPAGISFEEKAKNSIDKKILGVNSAETSPEGYVLIKSNEGVEVYLDQSKDLENQVRTLQSLLGKAKIENKEIILIDFRFEKIIVRFK